MSYWPYSGGINGDDFPDGSEDDSPSYNYHSNYNRMKYYLPLCSWIYKAVILRKTIKAILFEGVFKGKKRSFWVPNSLIRYENNSDILEEVVYIWQGFKPTYLLQNKTKTLRKGS